MAVRTESEKPKFEWRNVLAGVNPWSGKKYFKRAKIDVRDGGVPEPPPNFEAGTGFLAERPARIPKLVKAVTHVAHVEEAMKAREE